MNINAYDIALRFNGSAEFAGAADNPMIMSMLHIDFSWPAHDEVPWCSAFVNYIAWLLDLQRSKSLLARSWLKVGMPVDLIDAQRGPDIVILQRGSGAQPGPEVIDAPGHVGFFSSWYDDYVAVLGGNQKNMVCHQKFHINRILGIRRLHE